jgi:Asp/Glu/hydantoin racemase
MPDTTPTRVCLLHTVTGLPAVFAGLLPAEVGEVDAVNIVDETLLRDTVEHGMLARTRRRVAAYAAYAEESGARAVLVTCSSIGEAAEAARAEVGIPVYRVDEPMAAEAAATGRRIGVLATLSATLQPTRDLLRRQPGEPREITESVCPGAFEALKSGDTARHDAIVGAEVRRMAAESDVLVLAQASMARVVGNLPAGEVTVPVLTSPRSGVRQLRPYANLVNV